MKLLKFPVLAMLAVSALVTSCSDEGSWDGYVEKGDVYTFDQASANYNFTPVTVQDSIVITLTRSNTAEEVVLPIVADLDEGLTGPSEVKFAKGENQADYIITVGDLTIGEPLEATLSFDEELVSVSGAAECVVNIMLDYTWVSAGSCQMYSQWAGNSSPVRVPIEKAAEGDGLYRFESPYYYLEPNYCPEPGYHVQFYLDENYNALALDQVTFVGESLYAENDAVLVWFANGSYGCQFVNAGSTFLINAVMGYVQDGGAIGLYNYETIQLLWDRGYPGAQ
ncbi:MAG: hypothetical protein IJ342_04670 [Muribaculaceae bacterium]|nr:hypothetical protein [Muribaculaceae bacterium]